MSFKRFRTFLVVPACFVLSAILFAVITSRYNRMLAIVELCGIAAMSIVYLVWTYFARKDFVKLVLSVAAKVDLLKNRSLSSFPIPVVITNSVGEIELFNPLFSAMASDSRKLERGNISDFTSGAALEQILSHQGFNARYGDKYFSVYSGETKLKGRTYYIFYFIDDTELKAVSAEYKLSRPSVILVSIDGAEEIQANYNSNDYAEIRLKIDKMIDEWSSSLNCIFHRIGGDRYIMVVEERGLLSMISSRFKILDDVRGYKFNDKTVGFTLSMGVGHGENLPECEENARQALDMAHSRGGDQAAIKRPGSSYEFFGGISKGIERKTKVRTRIMASAITDLIRVSGDVMIMGHKYPDLDSLGSAVGLCSVAAAAGKRASIITDVSRSLARPLIERIIAEGRADLIESPASAIQRITKKTLLIVVDTHTADFVESNELLGKASSVIVIDHHRKSVNYINNALLFFHDPSASSASEMVTEIIQYVDTKQMFGKLEADALLSGIMLDTRNFVLRAGVRSFEAAAFLKRRGADTVKVKKMFSSSFESYKLRNEIILNAQMFRNCAVSKVDFDAPDIRVICAQAADELLNISDVDASFVLFDSNGIINISARSLGNMNVQIIMESLGGGGHQTMAAAQLSDCAINSAVSRLHAAIDDYYLKLNK